MAASLEAKDFDIALSGVIDHVRERFHTLDKLPVIPAPASITAALSALPSALPAQGMGTKGALDFILDNVTQGLWQGHAGPKMFGFVIGGVTPAAQMADTIAGSYDEQVQVALPQATISTALEQVTCDMVLDLLDIPRSVFAGKTVTTGATSSNILGLASGRDAVLLRSPALPEGYNIAEHGFPPHITSDDGKHAPMQVITVKPHGSILKAAAVTGIGRLNVLDCSRPIAFPDNPLGLAFDLGRLRGMLEVATRVGSGIIVVVSLGEVNTGGFPPDIEEISNLCKKHGAWLHIDAAFGAFAALLPEWNFLKTEMALADSLTLDAHKWLNAPYDTALFYTRRAEDLRRSFGPSMVAGGPAYLATTALPTEQLANLDESQMELRRWQETLESPLNSGLENSRRFRALPLFAALIENGKDGYTEIVQRNVDFAQRIADWMASNSAFEVLNLRPSSVKFINRRAQHGSIPLNVVLFRGTANSQYPPDDPTSSTRLVQNINDTREMYVSGTSWNGQGAVRIAVSNWRTARNGDENGDYDSVIRVLDQIGG